MTNNPSVTYVFNKHIQHELWLLIPYAIVLCVRTWAGFVYVRAFMFIAALLDMALGHVDCKSIQTVGGHRQHEMGPCGADQGSRSMPTIYRRYTHRYNDRL